MRAAVYRGPGEIAIEEHAPPPAPGPGELLVGVSKAAICGTDATEWLHGPLLARPPVVLGHEFVGRVLARGADVEGVDVGDRVVSGAGVSCGRCEWCTAGRTNLCAEYFTLGLHVDGGLADQVLAPAAICRVVPDDVPDIAAAMAQPLAVALHAVRRGGVARRGSCAVLGVGGIGAFALAGARETGAAPLIAVDVDDVRLATAAKLGADIVVDARRDDVVETVRSATGGGAEVVLEATGVPSNPDVAVRAVRRGGVVVVIGLQAATVPVDLFHVSTQEIDVRGTLAHVCAVDLDAALQLLSRNPSLPDAVLDSEIRLDDLVDDGIRRLAEGSAKGKIIVRVGAPQ